MLEVGLTGGIGTGKSYVRGRFEARGIPTIDADVLAREVIAPGLPGAEAVRARFGPDVMQADGSIDRRALGALVFSDAAARADLERIVHPAVYAAIGAWFAGRLAAGDSLAVADIPLLFETGRSGDFDVVVVAACAPAEQVRRVVRRDGITEAEASARIAAQWPIDEKVRRAHLVIRTDGSFAETDRLVDEVVLELRRMAGGAE
jgi:dephospho-CoA kinase